MRHLADDVIGGRVGAALVVHVFRESNACHQYSDDDEHCGSKEPFHEETTSCERYLHARKHHPAGASASGVTYNTTL
jgi:hypothetical protein